MNNQGLKNISLTFFNCTSIISSGREFLRVIICFKQKYFFAPSLSLLPVKWSQQTPLVLALWGWMHRNFLIVFPQISHYFLFHHYLYININTKKKHTTTTATTTITCLYKQETSRSFSRTFQVIYMQGRNKIHLKILGAPSVHSK